MSAETIIQMQGCKLTITVFAFESQESLGLHSLLALHLTRFTVHWQPQPVQHVRLSKLVRICFADYLFDDCLMIISVI